METVKAMAVIVLGAVLGALAMLIVAAFLMLRQRHFGRRVWVSQLIVLRSCKPTRSPLVCNRPIPIARLLNSPIPR